MADIVECESRAAWGGGGGGWGGNAGKWLSGKPLVWAA